MRAAFVLTAVPRTMSSGAATASPEPRGLQAPGGQDARPCSPRPRLQKLLGVPGSDPSRVNDLLLLRPDGGEQGEPAGQERGRTRHVVFFHGDIQVSDGCGADGEGADLSRAAG